MEKVIGKPSLLKQINRNIIIKLIIKEGPISRAYMSKTTGLALPSIMRLVDGLIKEEILMDIGKGDSNGGRKPNLVAINNKSMLVLGVEIAIETSIILTDLLGNIIDEYYSDEMAYLTPFEMLDMIDSKIKAMILDNNISLEKIAGIGIGSPGNNFKYVRDVDHSILKGWESIDIKSWFEERNKIKIYLDNVARTRTLGELWFGHGKTIDNFIYVFVDQGVGCGIVNNGIIHKGSNLVAGEFGHNVILYNGRPCYCGNNGCIEMYVSAGAITSEIEKAQGVKNLKFENISKESSELTNKIFINRGNLLAVGISNLINTYNPEAIILGGVVPLESRIFRETVLKEVNKTIFSKYAINTKIYITKVRKKGLGSIALVLNNYFESV